MCSVCGRVLKESSGISLCGGCLSQVKICDTEVQTWEEFCRKKAIKPGQISRGFDLCIHPCAYEGVVRDMVHRLKYKDKRDVAIAMAAMIKDVITKNNLSFDLVVPVPIHRKRLKKRGYNQSQLIAEELSNILNISHANVLERVRDTPSQVLFNGDMRWYNVKDAFQCRDDVAGKSILIVDDVITTGATIISCGEVLRASGASLITAASFALAN